MNVSERISYELEFIKQNPIFILGNENDISKIVDNYINNYDSFTIVYKEETFKDYNTLYRIYNKVKETNKKVLISSATSTDNYLFVHPLINLYFWQGSNHKKYINWNSETIDWFDKNYYIDFEKNNKGILSVRKKTIIRDRLFGKINNFDGIIRYASWAKYDGDETPELLKTTYTFPSILELIEEYRKSYISFVVETHTSEITNQLSDKTIFSFLTKTMPIVYGGCNYVKELKDMGFYVWNDEFGFEDGDALHTSSELKQYKFVKCIENFNKLSINEVKQMYSDNMDKIEKNFELVKVILEDNSWWKKNVIDI